MPVIRRARLSEHDKLVRCARTSKYTSGFSNIMYSGPANYKKGWIIVAKQGQRVVGGASIRHAVRKQQTTVYDIFVHPDYKRQGIARKMLTFIMNESPWNRIVLNVDKRNQEALDFYTILNFKKIASGAWKNGNEYVTLEARR